MTNLNPSYRVTLVQPSGAWEIAYLGRIAAERTVDRWQRRGGDAWLEPANVTTEVVSHAR